MLTIGLHATSLLLWGLVWHLFADWLLQNDWMARNKASLRHLAAWVHSGIHLVGLLLIFPPLAAVVIALTHLIIDTRLPLIAWRNIFRQTRTGSAALHVAMWGDQVAHIFILALTALVIGGFH